MSERAATPSPQTLAAQATARDPKRSVWVAANAGAGKTHVLTERVLRLLLDGAKPETVLCLTYTKAAAAEMRARVSARLADWALMEDGALIDTLSVLLGRPPTAGERERARTLFAFTLETPGDLKINTIHAFAESLLHRFPLEAGVPFDFSVIEDMEQGQMIARARGRVFAGAIAGENGLGAALGVLFAQLSDSQIDKALAAALGERRKLGPLLADPEGAKKRLFTAFLVGNEDNGAQLRRDILDKAILPVSAYVAVLAATPPDPDKTRFEDKLARIDPVSPDPEAVLAAFLTRDGGVPARGFPKKALMEAPGGLGDRVLAEAERLAVLVDKLKRVRLAHRSAALLDVAGAIMADYAGQKRARALLDFDDLIARTLALLSDTAQADWVRYKLDAGIDHVLVDESQDTNPEQWQVVRRLTDEFFAGQGAVERPRSVFAVGDPKQSIFSFQGAEPALFPQTGDEYAARAKQAGKSFAALRLKSSFRTLPGILAAVDKVFAAPDKAEALLASTEQVAHDSARTDAGGRVFLWPLAEDETVAADAGHWPLPEEGTTGRSGARVLAERIVGTIRSWLDEKRPLARRGRAVRPDDILILVQTRNALFQEIVRALKTQRIQSPGADRLAVASHIAVLDLLALGDVVLNPHDDLGLAALLRSPLFDIGEDDLFALAQPRGEVSLFSALGTSAIEAARDAHAALTAWRARLDAERPYEFFSHVLYAGGGLKRFHARLGPEVDDVLAEFLDLALAHEQTEQPGLQGFLVAMRARDAAIKRELSDAGGGVRVMTVHGAKGLEAPIVILAGASQTPGGPNTRPGLYFAQSGAGPYLVHAASKAEEAGPAPDLRDRASRSERAEYWRRLYVAMTRAEDELHVTGLGPAERLKESWFAAIETALGEEMGEAALTDMLVARAYPAADTAPMDIATDTEKPVPAPAPLVLDPVPAPVEPERVYPSEAGRPGAPDAGLLPAAEGIRDAETARREGLALHALLQHLPGVPAAERTAVAHGAIGQLLPGRKARWAALADQALDLIRRADLALFFGPDGRAEVPIRAAAVDNGVPIILTGRIDRLVVTPDRVVVIDYKTDAVPAPTEADAPDHYVRQLGLYRLCVQALYPGRTIEAAILWTRNGRLMVLSPTLLAKAVAGVHILGQT